MTFHRYVYSGPDPRLPPACEMEPLGREVVEKYVAYTLGDMESYDAWCSRSVLRGFWWDWVDWELGYSQAVPARSLDRLVADEPGEGALGAWGVARPASAGVGRRRTVEELAADVLAREAAEAGGPLHRFAGFAVPVAREVPMPELVYPPEEDEVAEPVVELTPEDIAALLPKRPEPEPEPGPPAPKGPRRSLPADPGSYSERRRRSLELAFQLALSAPPG